MVATTVLTGRVSSTGRLPVPGKQVADAIDGMVVRCGRARRGDKPSGSSWLIFADSMRVYIAAARMPPESEPAKR